MTDRSQQAPNPAPLLRELRASVQSLQLATIDEHNTPHCGYAPFVVDETAGDGAFVVFTSQLSLHTRDLMATARAGVMLIADESISNEIFARTRVSYNCVAEIIDTEHQRYVPLLDQLQQRHGKMIGLLRTLPDFVLFRLVPQSGQFVMGFGKAYRLTGPQLDEFEHATSA